MFIISIDGTSIVRLSELLELTRRTELHLFILYEQLFSSRGVNNAV